MRVLSRSLLLPLALLSASGLAAGERAHHRVLVSDREEVRLRASFPAPQTTRRGEGAGGWVEVTVPGAREVQRPRAAVLPEYTVLIAVPEGSTPALELLGATEEALAIEGVPAVPLPDPRTGRVSLAPGRPEHLRTLPALEPVSVEPLGIVRHVRLARLTFRPVRYGAEGWRALREAEVRVRFDPQPGGETTPIATPEADDVDVSLAASVINPEVAALAIDLEGTAAATEQAHTIPAPQPSVMTPLKVSVRTAGLYQVRRSDMTGAGVDPTGIDPRTFVLTVRGVEVPIHVVGEEDGVFDTTDVIRFYGVPVGGEQTWDNVYHLTGGVRTGLRMATRSAAPDAGHPVPTSFRNVERKETNFLYWGSLPASIDSPWYWDRLTVVTPGVPVSVTQPLTVTNRSTGDGTARLEVKLIGRRETPGATPNHHVRIFLNGNLVDDQTWTGAGPVTLGADVPQSWVLEGTNSVKVEDPSDLGLTVQEEWTDWIELSYRDTYVAEGDYLELGGDAAGPWRFEVTGFTGSDLEAYDVSNPAAPVRLTGISAQPAGATWTCAFSDAVATPPRRFAAVKAGSARTPASFRKDDASSLRSAAATGADVLIVAHENFWTGTQRLVTHRQGQGFRVVAAKLTDVYDEFNGGIAEIEGIRNFVEWAFANYAGPAPRYLVLIGDGTFDPMNHKGEGDNYIPVRQYNHPDFGLAPSDTWFGAVNGADELPDLAVGRIPVRSSADLTTYLDNLLDYENLPPIADLNSGLLYVSDDDDSAFEAVLEDLVTRFQPSAMTTRRVYLADYPNTTAGVASAKADIKTAINAGALLTTYMGHGGRTQWADESLWANGDVSALGATNRLTFTTALNCVNGYFMNLDAEPNSLGEQWNRIADRGSPANWAPSATGTLFNYDKLADELFRHIFDLRETRLGFAAWRSMLDAHLLYSVGLDYVRELVFIGDPAARLPLDSDRDSRMDVDELAAGTGPEDADSDDDGLGEQAETSWNVDLDGDGDVNASDFDADDDALPDGLERGVTAPLPSTNLAAGHYVADSDPATTTNDRARDTDGGGAPDGVEDSNVNGRVDAGETNPNSAADDPACAGGTPPQVTGLVVAKDAADLVISWTAQADPCVLYRVYVATNAGVPDALSKFVPVGLVPQASYRHAGAATTPSSHHYLVTAVSAAGVEGPLGHFGQ